MILHHKYSVSTICQPFSCPCSKNVTHCPKEICSTCLSKECIPAIPFGISKHPHPTRSRFPRATVRSTSSALWLHHAHPFVAVTEKDLSHAEKRRVRYFLQYSGPPISPRLPRKTRMTFGTVIWQCCAE